VIVVGSTTWIVVLTVVLAAAATRWGRRNRSPVWAPAPVVLSQLPTPELCLVWQRTCRALLDGPDGRVRERADHVLLLTGYRSDTTLLRQAAAAIDETIGAPVHDAETYETTVPGLFVIGACVAGQQSGRIFIENGRFHGEVVVKLIAERLQKQNVAV